MQLTDEQFDLLKTQFKTLKERSPFYAKKFEGIDLSDVQTQADFEKLPFSEKADLRAAYPLGLQAVPDEEVVRIHSSSGTTGTPVIIPYTQQDVTDWAIQFARCYETAGITNTDRIQITPGYGLWTAGIGFQLGAERLGAMAIPMGPGNTDKQLQMMQDLKSTVLGATSSYALLLAEEINERGLRDKIYLRKGVIGSERWGDKMRKRISNELGVEIFDIYGLTEVYGPGIGISCHEHNGMHVWSDYVYIEIVDPKTGEVLPDGEVGELVLTTLRKEGAPLIRYRTHDLTRIIPGACACPHGDKHPRIDILVGRTDDMFKVKGCNMFPAQVEEVIAITDGASSEYQVMIENISGRDVLTVLFETPLEGEEKERCEQELSMIFKAKIGCTPDAVGVPMGELPRSEKKTKRIFDSRY
ncbi:MAG TPA: phenylacetate--CoA ligase [Candidatus Aveggerthella stercoripullorum]|uniref:Phenylacetate-coenzyme A ligase n=1 Tax=Candidatus Aveggerthella stercoripullorum TaxID=2840688 RepID=A0A9D1A1U9_9ACTN|nr:phenylacetate--CoA ligase [Candidatus Aveggerthella stercoripullorum]